MNSYSEQQKKDAWSKAQPSVDPGQWRIDANGAWIKYDVYGNDKSPYGWTIDHIIPKKLFKNESNAEIPENRWALHKKNNESKAGYFPKFKFVVTRDDTKNISTEIEKYLEKDFLDGLLKKVNDLGVFEYINEHKEEFINIYGEELVKKWIEKYRSLYYDYHGKKLFSQCV